MIGKTLGHYQILEKIGEIGKSRYLSRPGCESLRQVPIKTLPDEFIHDIKQFAWMKRQAKLRLPKELKRGQQR